MVILIPRAFRFELILNTFDEWGSGRDEYVLKYISDLGKITTKSSAATRQDLKKVCETIIAKSNSNPSSDVLSAFSERVYFLVFDSIVDIDDKVLLERALPTCFANPEYQPSLATIKEKYGCQWMLARYV